MNELEKIIANKKVIADEINHISKEFKSLNNAMNHLYMKIVVLEKNQKYLFGLLILELFLVLMLMMNVFKWMH